MTPPSTQVTTLLKQFGLTTAAEELVPRLTQAGHHDALPVLLEVFEAEAEARRQRRIARLRRSSRLPPGKTFETLDTGRLPGPVVQQLKTLASGAFLDTATNVLAFGLPGVGKSHALCAVAHALVESGHSVLCVPAYALVQELLGAKRDLDLPRALRKLDLFEVILLDDLGYVQQSPDEAEVLFTLLAERYERRSVMVTSNLVFSQWDRIFRTRWPPPRRSTAWYTTRWCSSSTCRAFEQTRRGQRRQRRHHRQHVVDGRRVRCCRGASDRRPPERSGPEPSRASAATSRARSRPWTSSSVPPESLGQLDVELVEVDRDDRVQQLGRGRVLQRFREIVSPRLVALLKLTQRGDGRAPPFRP